MTERLKDKVAIVTGAASGIGRATVVRFIEEGACVVANDVNQSALKALAEEFRDRPGAISSIPGNVTERADTEAIVNQAVKHFGRRIRQKVCRR